MGSVGFKNEAEFLRVTISKKDTLTSHRKDERLGRVEGLVREVDPVVGTVEDLSHGGLSSH